MSIRLCALVLLAVPGFAVAQRGGEHADHRTPLNKGFYKEVSPAHEGL